MTGVQRRRSIPRPRSIAPRCELDKVAAAGGGLGVCRLADMMTIGSNDIGAMIIQTGLARNCPTYSDGQYRDLETEASRALPLPAYCGE